MTLEREDPVEQAPAGASPTPVIDPSMPADVIRNSPEYLELQRQNRSLARERGSKDTEVARLRAELERERQAAEASRAAAELAQVSAILGDDGVRAWSEIAELSQTDQVAAARRFAELMRQAASVQSGQQAAAGEAGSAPVQGGTTVTTQVGQTPPPPAHVEASAPLGQAGATDDYATIAADLEARYAERVTQMQDPMQRNRVGMKGIADGLISYLGAAYLKAGARPKSDR